MLSLFQIDFTAQEFVWAMCGGLLLAIVYDRTQGRASRACRHFAERPLLPAIAVGLVMFSVQVGVAARYGWPAPAIHDEFSYLLAADTFSAGRATNPTHPLWEYFETYHVLSQPTYQSKYPPGNGLVLALGQILSKQPIVGVWICLAAATSGLFWMLRGWVASRWALLGAVILICNWPLTKLWGQTYFGGAPALFGGVLVYGAFVRLLRRPRVSTTICLGLGLLIWAITRPYEGLVASSVPLAILCWRGIVTDPATRYRWLTRVAAPLIGLLVCGGAMLGWYHQQVTGSPWKWPYRLYEETYTRRVGSFSTLFSWTDLGARGRTIPSLEYQSSAAQMRIAETKPVLYGTWKIVRQWWFHVGLLGTLPCYLGCVTALRSVTWRRSATSRSYAWAIVSIALVGTAILLQRSAGLPHYAAPILPLFVLLIVQGLRCLRIWRIANWRVGSLIVGWLAWTFLLFFTLPLVTGSNQPNVRPWSLERSRIQQELESRPRASLVIVKYHPGHSMHEEWVYNRADLQHAHVVWARDLSPQQLPQLLERYPDRDVWTIEPDRTPITLKAYAR